MNSFYKNRFCKRAISLLITSFMMTALTLTGCQAPGQQADGGEAEEETLLAVTVTSPVSGNIAVQGEFSGTLEHGDEISVFPKLSGEVTAAYFEEGDYVNAGDLLFTLDDEAYQMSLKNAQATYNSAKAGTDQQLGALQMNRDNAENSLKTAEEGIGQAENTYSYYQGQYGDLEDKKEDLEEDKHDLKKDKKKTRRKYNQAKTALNAAKASGATEAQIAELQSAVNTLKSALDSMESGLDSYDDAIDTIESNEDTLNYQMGNLGFSYEQAKRGAELARESLEYFDNVTMPATIRTAEATMEQAQVGIDSAKLQIEYTQVTAPVSGYIKTKNVDRYDMAQAGAPAYVITNNDTLMAAFNVPESAFKNFEKGQQVKIDRNGTEYDAVITEMDENVSASTGLFEVKAAVAATEKELSTGTAVKITAVTDHAENVLTVPVDCIYYSGGESFTYAVENGEVRKVYVKTGLYDADNIEITEGLTPDMQIITVWSSDLRDGLKVEVVQSDAEKSFSAVPVISAGEARS